MAIRFHIMVLLSLLLTSCSDDSIVTSCSHYNTHFTLRATNETNGEFVKAIAFDTSAGVVFRGFDLIESATDVRNGVEMLYVSTLKELQVKTRRNNRILKGVEKQCVTELREFLSSAKIDVPIVYQ